MKVQFKFFNRARFMLLAVYNALCKAILQT